MIEKKNKKSKQRKIFYLAGEIDVSLEVVAFSLEEAKEIAEKVYFEVHTDEVDFSSESKSSKEDGFVGVRDFSIEESLSGTNSDWDLTQTDDYEEE